ncbi:MAG: hypothetical protein Q9181_005367, partial [Wetmoreana brouardii]
SRFAASNDTETPPSSLVPTAHAPRISSKRSHPASSLTPKNPPTPDTSAPKTPSTPDALLLPDPPSPVQEAPLPLMSGALIPDMDGALDADAPGRKESGEAARGVELSEPGLLERPLPLMTGALVLGPVGMVDQEEEEEVREEEWVSVPHREEGKGKA